MNVTESNAVFVLLRFIGHDTIGGAGPPEDRDVATAIELLGQRAGQTLGIHQYKPQLAASAQRFLGRLRAADSDGAAQAVCRGLANHVSHGGSVPWPTVRRPFEEWQAIQAAVTEEVG